MARTKISEFSATPGNNTDIDGINIAEGCAPSGINDAIRELMSQLKDFQAGTAGDSFNGPVGTSTAAAGAFTTLSASSTVSGTGFSNYLASPPAIGGTAAAAGSFTTLSASSTVTLSGGTANGVLYLNGSKVATSGSALTFDGTYANLTLTSGTTANGFLQFSNSADGGTQGYIGDSKALITGGDNSSLAVRGESAILFGIASSEGMRLTSTGLGIGTSSPTTKLYVYSAGTNVATLDSPAANENRLDFAKAGTRKWSLYSPSSSNDLRIYDNQTVGDVVTFQSGGNVGIGTSSPGGKLEVYSGASGATAFSNGNNLIIQNSAAVGMSLLAPDANACRIYFGTASNNRNAFIYSDYNSGAQTLIFGVGTSTTAATERMRLDSSGNLGLGVTPSAWNSVYRTMQIGLSSGITGQTNDTKLFINNNAYYSSANQWVYLASSPAAQYQLADNIHRWYNAASGTAGNAISFTQAMTLDASGNLGVGTSSLSGNGRLELNVPSGNNTNLTFYENGSSRWLIGSVTGSNAFRFYDLANSTERARITSGGYFKASSDGTYVNSTASYYEFRQTTASQTSVYNTNTTADPYGIRMSFTGASPNSTDNWFFYCEDSGPTLRMSVRSNGGIANFSGNNVNLSDRREKTNFAPAGEYLSKICAIPVQTFNYIDQNMEEDPGLTLGVVAQDVQAVAPELVMESNWGTKDEPKMRLSIYQTDLQYALMKCIQEQQVMINELKAKVAALEAK